MFCGQLTEGPPLANLEIFNLAEGKQLRREVDVSAYLLEEEVELIVGCVKAELVRNKYCGETGGIELRPGKGKRRIEAGLNPTMASQRF